MRWLPILLLTVLAADDWQAVRLAGPLNTVLQAPRPLPAEVGEIGVEVEVPADAPPDLGIGVWVGERHGGWFQQLHGWLRPGGRQVVRARLDADAPWSAEPAGPRWSAWRRQAATRWGVFLWSAQSGGAVRLRWSAGAGRAERSVPSTITAVQVPTTAVTGQRWMLTFRPDPYPWQPFDPAVFAADLVVTAPDGRVERLPAFHDQPIDLVDRGDAQRARLAAPERFSVRWRPRQPGRHRLALAWSADGGAEHSAPLPEVEVAGAAWDDYVRVDAKDPRFLARGDGSFWWPVGLNLQSVTDPRTREVYQDLPLRPTPDLGTRSYDAYLARLAAAGGDAAEIWLCSWNLGLEWDPRWYGYFGLGRYSEFNAARLDAVLDRAWSLGIRLVLNLNNHGQFLPGSVEDEWPGNPYNRANGGPLKSSDDIFTDAEAQRRMRALRRYLAGRCADHPAVLTWKLWSEVDLTSLGIRTIRGNRDDRGLARLRRWHEEAAADWKRLDTYGHPVSTHFATTWRNAHPEIAGASGIDLVLLDAYFKAGVYTDAEALGGLMVESTQALARLRRPILVTEYGGGHEDRLLHKLDIEHAGGAFLALVSGHAGAPMLWWREWVDQQGKWQPYQAIRAFIAGEDLRGEGGRSVALRAASPAGRLWCRAWVRPGRLLLYVQDHAWAVTYREGVQHQTAQVVVGEQVAAGAMQVSWWDADTGAIVAESDVAHPGGRLALPCPAFKRHIAAKIVRR